MLLRLLTILVLLSVGLSAPAQQAPSLPAIQVVPRSHKSQVAKQWNGGDVANAWRAAHDVQVEMMEGYARVVSTGEDPYIIARCSAPAGQYQVVVEYRAATNIGGVLSLFWATDQPFSGTRRRFAELQTDQHWHKAVIAFDADRDLTQLRLDPGSTRGTIDIRAITLHRVTYHPLVIERVSQRPQQVDFGIRNTSSSSVAFTASKASHTVGPGELLTVGIPVANDRAVTAVTLDVHVPGWDVLRRTVSVYTDKSLEDWHRTSFGDGTFEIAGDGSAARWIQHGHTVYAIAPIVMADGRILRGGLARHDSRSWHFKTADCSWTVRLREETVGVEIESSLPVEGPVVRAIGPLQQGLLAGVEYLGKGEHSSSTLDIETEEHVRFAPDPHDVTMPLMAFSTPAGTTALTWDNMMLHPVYATPDFIDGTHHHRMALRGTSYSAIIRHSALGLEESIQWCVQRRKLPRVPAVPRSPEEQRLLDLKGLAALHDDGGWRHALGPQWRSRPYADMGSTIWRLGGELDLERNWQPGGAHIPNNAIFLLTNRGPQWQEWLRRRTQGLISQQQPDGSFRYHGKYARGHFEDTASGYCAVRATHLLEAAFLTGDEKALAAGIRALDYMLKFNTPRGAQTWECPLHTPDLLASAYLVWAYVRGYELTHDERYLNAARKWALSGMPFVYQWSDRPMMAYATTAVFGATNWTAPNWIGRPVQWVGIVYGYALALLAPYDSTLEWRQVARGILLCARQMQYPDGPSAGLLPDSLELKSQRRLPADINPCSMVSLERLLAHQVDSLAVARSSKHHVTAPFPVKIHDGHAVIDAQRGAQYQVLIDGERWQSIRSVGTDRILLERRH